MQFGKIGDSRVYDMFSIIIKGFPIICYRIYNFRNHNSTKQFNNPNDDFKVRFLWVLGFHVWTKDHK